MVSQCEQSRGLGIPLAAAEMNIGGVPTTGGMGALVVTYTVRPLQFNPSAHKSEGGTNIGLVCLFIRPMVDIAPELADRCDGVLAVGSSAVTATVPDS